MLLVNNINNTVLYYTLLDGSYCSYIWFFCCCQTLPSIILDVNKNNLVRCLFNGIGNKIVHHPSADWFGVILGIVRIWRLCVGQGVGSAHRRKDRRLLIPAGLLIVIRLQSRSEYQTNSEPHGHSDERQPIIPFLAICICTGVLRRGCCGCPIIFWGYCTAVCPGNAYL